jgi:hypothetical protein
LLVLPFVYRFASSLPVILAGFVWRRYGGNNAKRGLVRFAA